MRLPQSIEAKAEQAGDSTVGVASEAWLNVSQALNVGSTGKISRHGPVSLRDKDCLENPVRARELDSLEPHSAVRRISDRESPWHEAGSVSTTCPALGGTSFETVGREQGMATRVGDLRLASMRWLLQPSRRGLEQQAARPARL